MNQQPTRIQIIGITDRAVEYIEAFMKTLSEAGYATETMIPMIGMAIATKLLDEDGNTIEQTGPRLLLGALEKSHLTDEQILKVNPFDIAVRIPDIDAFAGAYYFDINGRRFVNIFNNKIDPQP